MTKRERRHAEFGWVMFKVMATLLYEKMLVKNGFFIGAADKGLRELRSRKPSPFQRYRKEKRRCIGLRSSRGSWRAPSSGTSGITTCT